MDVLYTRPAKVIYIENDQVIKVFDETYSKSNILNEALNQARVEETGLYIPHIIEVTKIHEKWAIVMDYIEGDTLEELLLKDPQNTDFYMQQFVDLQCFIHTKRSPFLTKFKDKLKEKILKSDLDASTRYDLSIQLEGMPNHVHLCHGDYNPSNVVVSKDGHLYILDWAHASQGNATADFAKTYLTFILQGQKDLAEKYLELYRAREQVELPYFRKWVSLVAAAQLIKNTEEAKKKILMSFVNAEELE